MSGSFGEPVPSRQAAVPPIVTTRMNMSLRRSVIPWSDLRESLGAIGATSPDRSQPRSAGP